MAHGNIYPPERVDAALANYFRPGQPRPRCASSRCCGWPTRSTSRSQDYMEAHGIAGPWETRERVVVAITGAPGGDDAHPARRRAWRCAPAASSSACTCAPADGLAGPPTELLDEHRRAPRASSAARTTRSSATTSARRWSQFARAENATQLVLGASRRSRWAELTRGSVINRVIRASGPIDVHVISTERGATPHAAEPGGRGAPRRRVASVAAAALVAWALAVVGAAAAHGRHGQRARHARAAERRCSLYLLVVVAVAAIGGVRARAGRERDRVPARQLVLHPAAPQVHHLARART